MTSQPSGLGSAYVVDTECRQRPHQRFFFQSALHSAALFTAPTAISRRRPKGRGCFRQDTGGLYMLGALIYMVVNYTSYATVVLSDLLTYEGYSALAWSYIACFHCFFSLFLLSFIQTARTNPGSVPINWGFYMGDEYKRHRYCRVCNIWKPDRTHHCSACDRCVLNMDHHCPWVNNCVGFYNRKFFILLLFYGMICLVVEIAHTSLFIIYKGASYVPHSNDDNLDTFLHIQRLFSFVILLLTLLLSITLCIGLIPFARFHMAMLRRNSTTVENLDVNLRNRRQYDIGQLRNIQQVMGANIFFWWLPWHTKSTRPVGDGVRWNQHYVRAFESDDAGV